MARLGQIPLTNLESGLSAGGAFRITPECSLSSELQIPSGAVAEVDSGNEYLVVRLPELADDTVLGTSFESGQVALDWWSVTGRGSYDTKRADKEHLLWWSTDEGLVIKVVSEVSIDFTIGPLTATVRGPEDNGEAPRKQDTSQVAKSAHPGFRYFRRAQNTDNLHDAYRNLWLAFEHTLSSRYPPKPNEREIDWLERALANAVTDLDLSKVLRSDAQDLSGDLINKLYTRTRLPLFHSKRERSYDEPQSIAARRQEILDSYQLLLSVTRKMFSTWYDARWKGGAVFTSWVYDSVEQMLGGSELVVSDRTEIDPTESDLSHERFDRCPRTAINRIYRKSDGVPCVEASLNTAEEPAFDDLSSVQGFEIIGRKHPIMAHILEAPLYNTSDIARVITSLSVNVRNVSQPRTHFSI